QLCSIPNAVKSGPVLELNTVGVGVRVNVMRTGMIEVRSDIMLQKARPWAITSSQLPPAGEPRFRRCIAVASTPPGGGFNPGRPGQRDAQWPGAAWAEAVAGQDRDLFPLHQAAGEPLRPETGAAHVEQYEHAAFGRCDAAVGRLGEDRAEPGGAPPVILAQHCH